VVVSAGSPGYVPPELYGPGLNTEHRMSVMGLQSVDVFAFGVLVAAVCTHNDPYDDMGLGGEELLEKVATGGLRPEVKGDWPQKLGEVVRDCMKDWGQRPTFLRLREGFQGALRDGTLPRCRDEVYVPCRAAQ
jgi:serine/threonine protein kinase